MHLHFLLIASALLSSIEISSSVEPHWNYGAQGPDVWKDFYPMCAGGSQSPINIQSVCTTYQAFDPFQFSLDYFRTQTFVLTNNGHTISGTQLNAAAYPLILSGGGLSGTFTFRNFHLHWGENYNSGSEHQLNGQKYAAEVHFVHANSDGSLFAALGMFIQSGAPTTVERRKRHTRRKREVYGADNVTVSEWTQYFNRGEQLNATNSTTTINLTLSTLMGTHLNQFYRYAGSFTTPPCSEVVTWTVFKVPIEVNNIEIDEFRRHVYFEDYRGPQPVNSRTVYRNFVNDTASNISDYNHCCTPIDTLDLAFRAKRSRGNAKVFLDKHLIFSYFVFIFVFLSL